MQARGGHANVVALLANERVDVNALSKTGESALLIASRYGHVDVVQALLERGANAAIRDQAIGYLLPTDYECSRGYLLSAHLQDDKC
ncbi:unnamed protein product [Cylicostephanus goldi]|uniref:Uncharacterized protein n=1 Tax=Cylicostephanus goldi TaxID=71465 RepID=A0A3P7R2E3_CYLGO|nr:unnamed protein product [Cylicostephanus goldi]